LMNSADPASRRTARRLGVTPGRLDVPTRHIQEGADRSWRDRDQYRERSARQQQIGLYEPVQPLRLQAFELRLLSRQAPPDRWLIDLTSNGDTLIAPQSYSNVPLPEDRLFIPAEYVPLWVEKGWKRP
jgi:hypothetical protein